MDHMAEMPESTRSGHNTQGPTTTSPVNADERDRGLTPSKPTQQSCFYRLNGVHEKADKIRTEQEMIIEFIHGITKASALTQLERFGNILEREPIFPLARFGQGHTATTYFIDMRAWEYTNTKPPCYMLAEDMKMPVTHTTTALPNIVACVGLLVRDGLKDKSRHLSTSFWVLVDILSESKDIWFYHADNLADFEFDINHQVCADFLPQDKDSSVPSARGGGGGGNLHTSTDPLRFNIARLDLTWDELVRSNMPEDLRRTRITQGIAQSARSAGVVLKIMPTRN